MMSDPLGRYNSILKGNLSPAYKRGKGWPVEFTEEMSDGELWKLHADALTRFHHSLEGEETSTPSKSLMDLKLALSHRMLSSCSLCERDCGADRTKGETGHCDVKEARIASHFLHYGEERPLVPSYTIFFAGCNFECDFCQNGDISSDPQAGRFIEPTLMARRLENLSEVGRAGFKVTLVREWNEQAKNVNWVGGEPTPNLAYVLQVLHETKANLPQIWNSNMYMSENALRLLDGTIDLYLADFKYGNDECARRYSHVEDYFRVVSRNHRRASEQADLLVRHLMLPGHLDCCTVPVLEWLSQNVPNAQVNIMDQYRPMHKAHLHPELLAKVGPQELEAARELARQLGLRQL
jgi:putative pyruvate formate lyase activating enzyme